MYLDDLFEAKTSREIIVIFPGRFHMFHVGHKEVYDYLEEKFDAPVFIATSGKIDHPKSPFSFAEKVVMMKAAGIPTNRITKENEPYRPINLLKKMNPHKYSLIVAVGEKDLEERFKPYIGYKKNGEPTYFQYLDNKNVHELVGFLDHGYVVVAPTVTNKRGTVISGTNIRRQFKRAYKTGPDAVDKLVADLYGSQHVNNGSLRDVLIKLSGTGDITSESTLVGTYGKAGPKAPGAQLKGKQKVGQSRFKRHGSQKNATKGQLVGDSIDPKLLRDNRKRYKPPHRHVVPRVGAKYHILINKMEEIVRVFDETDDPMSPEQKQDLVDMMKVLRRKIRSEK